MRILCIGDSLRFDNCERSNWPEENQHKNGVIFSGSIWATVVSSNFRTIF